MKKKNCSLAKLLSLLLTVSVMLGSLLPSRLSLFAFADAHAAQIGDAYYDTLAAAIAAVPTGEAYSAPSEPTVITLLSDVGCGFDVGDSKGTAPKNIILDLAEHTLTLRPAVGSKGTVSNGIRVLACSKLHIKNGSAVCSDEPEDNIKVGIANYSELTLENVELKSGSLTQYTVNNRGKLTLLGTTSIENGKVLSNDYTDVTEYIAVTNDPYKLYSTLNGNNASVVCDSDKVRVGNLQLECYENTGKSIILDISAGSFGKVFKPAAGGNITVDGSCLTGGSFESDISEYVNGDECAAVYDSESGLYKVKELSEVTDFKFETAVPEDRWIGEDYTNTASSELSDGKVTYEIADGEDIAEINKDTGELSFKKTGKVTVKAVIAKTASYKSASVQYTVNAVKAAQDGFKFSTTAPELIYSEGLTYKNEAEGGDGNGAVTYEITDGDCASIDKETGKVTVTKAGTVTVRATKAADDTYNEATAEYTLTVKPAEQSGLTVNAPSSITFVKDTPQSVINVTGKSGSGKITYSITDGSDFASIDSETGAITTLKASETADGECGTITVKIEVAGDECYKAAEPVTKQIAVCRAEQTGFAFEKKDSDELKITYNDNGNRFTNTASGGQSAQSVVYEITDGENIADIDSRTGELTIKCAGTVTVKAVKGADTCYNSAEASYTLTVAHDEPEFTVNDNESLIYGVTEYSVDVQTVRGSGNYEYSVDENDIGASVDDSGKITFKNSVGKVGSVTVRVKSVADECYSAKEKSFMLTLSYLNTDGVQPVLSGDRADGTEWYKDTVTIAAPDGYEISYSDDLTENEWGSSVTVSTDGINSKDVYLKNDEGISDKITVKDIKIDKVAPEEIKITYDKPFIEKTLERVTFGIYKAKKVNVTLTATDKTSGMKCFTYNIGNGDVVVDGSDITDNKDGTFSYTFTVSAEFRDKVKMRATDNAGNISESAESEHTLVVDSISPELEVKYEFEGSENFVDTVYYTDKNVTVKFEIKEDNFDLREKDPVLTVNGEDVSLEWQFDDASSSWQAEYGLSDDGRYELSLGFSDASGNEMKEYKRTVVIDGTKPTVTCNYDITAPVGGSIYDKARTAVITVVEDNFNAENVVLKVTAEDITGAPVDISSKNYGERVKAAANWKTDGNEHTLTLPAFDIDAVYSVEIECTDLAGNSAEKYSDGFTVDTTAPDSLKIEYSSHVKFWEKLLNNITFGYYSYKDELTVTVTADDITSGADSFVRTYTGEFDGEVHSEKITSDNITYENGGKTAKAVFTVPAEARGSISVTVTDKAGNGAVKRDSDRISIVDSIRPELSVKFSKARVLDKAEMTDVETYSDNSKVILYYENEAEVTISVKEANFIYNDDGTSDVKVTLTKNGVDSTPAVSWTYDESSDKHIGRFTVTGDGDCLVKVSYADRSGNAATDYTSPEIHIDGTSPTVTAEYFSDAEVKNGKYYSSARRAVITVTEHNFLADGVAAEVTATDVRGEKIPNADKICAEIAEYLKKRSSWTHNGDNHTAEITFGDDAQYTLKIDCADILGNNADTYSAEPFAVDMTAPDGVTLEYSKPVWFEIIEAVTFGFYKSEVQVTVTADDITSGVDYFDWTYTKEAGASDKNAAKLGARITSDKIKYENGGKTAKAVFTVPAEARGYIAAVAADRAGNSESKTDKNTVTVAVDSIAPSVSVSYRADSEKTAVRFTDAKNNDAKTFADASHAYYGGDVTARIVINEANFFEGTVSENGVIHNVGIKLIATDDGGNTTVYEYLPNGAEQKYDGAVPRYIGWNNSGDEHSFEIAYTENADYVLETEYTDFSSNDADISSNDGGTGKRAYRSKTVTVDKTSPLVEVVYGNGNVVRTVGGRKYFDDIQTVTVTVKEHNFRADDFAAGITAKDVLGNDVSVADFKKIFSDGSNWTSNGDVHTVKAEYSADANYTFTYTYEDLARNAAASYGGDSFTVDKTVPKNLTVSYSQSVADRVLEAVSFGYYNAKVTVTVTAEDDTSGIERFEYAYLKSEGVSSVNAELLKAAIREAQITVSGKKYTAVFEIPKDVLRSENQFNGTVSFTAFDRAENSSEKADTRRVIVDNIAPAASVTYTAPVQRANGISYYGGNIGVTVVITEANFNSEDVAVNVNGSPAAVKWVDNSADVHTGTFTLTEDGDYVVTVDYTDRSENKMASYTSERLTLDKKVPTVNVTGIKQNSANKDEKYSFTVTADDINLDASSFKPVLTATVRAADGSYGTRTVPLGEMKTVEAGKTYTFAVDNLEDDAVYTLSCSVKDMSGNTYSSVLLEDGRAYDGVSFSVNRNGSTFAADKNTNELVERYYVYSVGDDVVIEEVNVDPVESYTVRLNGKALSEGTDYTTALTENDGEWSKRTYTISKDVFSAEGEYSVVIESVDKTETTAYSDVKNLKISFVVDQSAPVLTVSGLENGGRYRVGEQTVTVIPTDDGGRLYSLKAVVLNADGEPLKNAAGEDISVRFEMSGEEFLTYLAENGGKVTFTVPEGLENQVRITCSDCAVNADGQANEYDETFTKITVSQSGLVIFYANKPLFYGSAAGAVLLIGGICFLTIFGKRRKKKSK